MSRDASLSAVALRLHNLELKVGDGGGGGGDDSADFDRFVRNILDPEGATSVGPGETDPSKMLSYYDLDGGTSLVRSIFGVSMWGDNRGPSYAFLRSLDAPFYQQVFRDLDGRWEDTDNEELYPGPLAEAAFGSDSNVVNALRDNATSLADLLLAGTHSASFVEPLTGGPEGYGAQGFLRLTLGSPGYVSAIREGSILTGQSLCGILFGSEESLSDYLGEFPFVSILDRIVALESKVATLEGLVADILSTLANHGARLSAGGL